MARHLQDGKMNLYFLQKMQKIKGISTKNVQKNKKKIPVK
jgi:hypothetical protein